MLVSSLQEIEAIILLHYGFYVNLSVNISTLSAVL